MRISRIQWFTLFISVAFLCPHDLSAHQPFQSYIQHQTTVQLSKEYIDLELELTFYNLLALSHRQEIDQDKNEEIGKPEIEDYLSHQEDLYPHLFSISINGKRLQLIPLYEPELKLLGDPRTAPSPFQLRFFLFAEIPLQTDSNMRIELQDQLFPDYPAVCIWNTTAQDGIRLTNSKSTVVYTSKAIKTVPRIHRIHAINEKYANIKGKASVPACQTMQARTPALPTFMIRKRPIQNSDRCIFPGVIAYMINIPK